MTRPAPKLLIYSLFLFSGGAGLVYELVWTRQLILLLGGTTYAITTVLVAFMAGLALGSHLSGRIADRVRQPGWIYGWLEIIVALFALAVPALLMVAQPLYRHLYPSVSEMPWVLTGVRFGVGCIVLLIPTTCMGATLPMLVRFLSLQGDAFGRSVGLLYGINTFGAFLGVTLAGFWLIPALGLARTTLAAAAVNVFVGVVALVFLRQRPNTGPEPAARPVASTTSKTTASKITRSSCQLVLLAFAASGFAAMVYQITWTRALIICVGSSTYAFTCILSAFILGLALGSLAMARWVDRWRNPLAVLGLLEFGIALSAVLIVPLHGQITAAVARLVAQHHQSYSTLLGREFQLIIAVTFVPTFLMGAVFPLATRLIAGDETRVGSATGRAYAVNTVGTILGSFLAGFVLIRSDVLGVQRSIVFAAVLNTLIGGWLLIRSRPVGAGARPQWLFTGGALATVMMIAGLTGKWNRQTLISAPYLRRQEASPDREVLFFADGVDTTVAVYTTKGIDNLVLTVNAKPDASIGINDLPPQLLAGHLPALLTPDARSACVIGLGSGMSLAAVSRYPAFERLDCVEISEEVIKASELFRPYNYNILHDDPRVRMYRGDGRNHLLLTDNVYDIIISEPSNPWVAGIANLFTREFFEVCKARLSDQGHLCVWLHGYEMSVRNFQSVIRTLFDVFEQVSIWQTNATDYMLIARPSSSRVPLDGFLRMFSTPAVREDLYRIGVSHPGDILGKFITAGQPLREWASAAPLHTDDNALLEFSAPRHIYDAEHLTINVALVKRQQSPFEQIVSSSLEEEQHRETRKRATAVAEARRLRLNGANALLRGEIHRGLTTLLEGYARDSGNLSLYQALIRARRSIPQRTPEFANTPGITPLLEMIDGLREPTVAPPSGATLAESVGQLHRLWVAAAEKKVWNHTIEYAREAYDLDSTNGQSATMLAFGLAQTGHMEESISLLERHLARFPLDGRVNWSRGLIAVQQSDFDKALVHLDAAMRSGAIPVSLLADEPDLQPIRIDPRFQALTERYESGNSSD